MKISRLRDFIEMTKNAPADSEVFVSEVAPPASIHAQPGWSFKAIHIEWLTFE